jgi:FG-GAP repeat
MSQRPPAPPLVDEFSARTQPSEQPEGEDNPRSRSSGPKASRSLAVGSRMPVKLSFRALFAAPAAVLVVSFASATARAGDFDRNGYDDLAIGAPGETVGGHLHAGIVNVLYGGREGFKGRNTESWTQDSERDGAAVRDSVDGEEEFGKALTSGDFDDDGYDDLAIGAPGEPGYEEYGVVHVLYGSRNGLTARGNDLFRDANPVLFDYFGAALAAGDFGKGDQDDLAIGIPKDDAAVGEAHVLFGSNRGISNRGRKVLEDETPHGLDYFGSALAAGDFGKSAKDDLAIGAPGDDTRSSASGNTLVFYGGDRGPRFGDQLPGFFSSIGAGQSGWSLAAGNFLESHHDDLAIGAPYTDLTAPPGLHVDGGLVEIYRGGPSGTGTSPFFADVLVESSPGTDNRFGFALAAGNFGQSPYDDLTVGAPGVDLGSSHDVGRASIHFGAETEFRDYYWERSQEHTAQPLREADDLFGLAVTMGDFGYGPRDDTVVAAPGEDVGSITDAGSIAIFYSVREPGDAEVWNQGDLAGGGGPEPHDVFGRALR